MSAALVDDDQFEVDLEGGDRPQPTCRVWMIATMEPGMIGLMEPRETASNEASESRSSNRFHEAPQGRFGFFREPAGRALARTDVFSTTAARMSAFNAFSLILSPSCISMARLVLPSRLELKRREGSSNEAPLAKVIFTTFLYVSPVQIIPACDHTGTPRHFHSSTTSGSACLMRFRTRASVSPRQSLSSLILVSIR